MNNIIEFEGLKFKTSLNFRNKREEGNYWDNLIIDSIHKFRTAQKEYFYEKLHILMSYFTLLKHISYGVLSYTFLYTLFSNSPERLIIYILILISIIIFVVSLLFYRKFKDDTSKYVFTTTLNGDDDFINMIRDEVIKSKYEKI